MIKFILCLFLTLPCFGSGFCNVDTEHFVENDNSQLGKIDWTPGTGSFRSFVTWFKSSSFPNADGEHIMFTQISDNNTGGHKYGFFLYYSGGLANLLMIANIWDLDWTNLYTWYYTDPGLSTNTWHHMVYNIEEDETDSDFYVDLTDLGTLTMSGTIDTQAMDVTQLRLVAGNTRIDDDNTQAYSALFDAQLDADERNMMYYNPWWCIGHANLLGFWPMDEFGGTNLLDRDNVTPILAASQNSATIIADDPPIPKRFP